MTKSEAIQAIMKNTGLPITSVAWALKTCGRGSNWAEVVKDATAAWFRKTA